METGRGAGTPLRRPSRRPKRDRSMTSVLAVRLAPSFSVARTISTLPASSSFDSSAMRRQTQGRGCTLGIARGEVLQEGRQIGGDDVARDAEPYLALEFRRGHLGPDLVVERQHPLGPAEQRSPAAVSCHAAPVTDRISSSPRLSSSRLICWLIAAWVRLRMRRRRSCRPRFADGHEGPAAARCRDCGPWFTLIRICYSRYNEHSFHLCK